MNSTVEAFLKTERTPKRELEREILSATTSNGAKSNATTGTEKFAAILNYFFKAGTYVGRDQGTVNQDMYAIFADDPITALKVVFGLRLISRKYDKIEDTQTGYGRKDEFYKAVVWLHKNHPDMLYKNLHLIPVFGCWKDLFNEPLVSILNKEEVYKLVAANLSDNLLRKYLPQIYSEPKAKKRSPRCEHRSTWAKGFCEYMKIGYKAYRNIKKNGLAHQFQQHMSANEWDQIDFKKIPGKAMLLAVSRKGKDTKTVFERHNLTEALQKWAETQTLIKFTGYPYELTRAASARKNPSVIQKMIYNKQFDQILEPFKNHNLGNVFCALDTSGSMSCEVAKNVSAYDICISMGLVFSSLNIGSFKDTVVKFSSISRLLTLNGDFCSKLEQIENSGCAMGDTDFQSVIDLIVKIRKEHPNIPLEDYPETLLVISDMQFSPAGSNTQTNYEVAMAKLKSVGLGEMRIIWWCVNGDTSDFPAKMDDKGVYMIGGFDPANLKALCGLTKTNPDLVKSEQTPLNGLMNFISQPIFNCLSFK